MPCSVLPVCQCHVDVDVDKHDPGTKMVTHNHFLLQASEPTGGCKNE